MSKLIRQVKVVFYCLLGHLFANFNATKQPSISMLQYIMNNNDNDENQFVEQIINVFWSLSLVLYHEVNIDLKIDPIGFSEDLQQYSELIVAKQNIAILAKQFLC